MNGIRGDFGQTPRISLIIPAHDEEARIAPMLHEYAREFTDAELIVVLNGCTDGTLGVVERVSAVYPCIRIIEIAEALGKGGAIRAGMKLARAEVVAYVDADGSTSAGEMRRLCRELGDADAVIASRWIAGSVVTGRSVERRLASSAFNTLVRLLFGLPFADTQCGAKVFRRNTLLEVFGQLETSGLAFDVDLLYCLIARRKRIREVPTVWKETIGSRIRLLDASIVMFTSLLRLRLRHSILRVLVPAFDRWLPTKAMRTHDKLNVLLINRRDPKHPKAGAPERYCYHVARSLIEAGHHVEWLCAGFSGASKHDQIDGISIRRVGNGLTIYVLAGLEYIRYMRDRFNVIIDSENGFPFLTPLFSLKPKILFVYHVRRDVFLSRLPAPLSWLSAIVALKVVPLLYRDVRIVTISESTKRDLDRLGRARLPIEVVEPGIAEYHGGGSLSKEPVILYVGLIEPYKRLDLLLRAFAKVRAECPAAELRIAGTGTDLESLKRLAGREGLAESVRFLGQVTQEEKAAEYSNAWLFVNPSAIQGWQLSVREAAASGTPSIAFNGAGLPEFVVDGVTGTIVAAGADEDDAADALAVAILSYLRSPALCRQHGINAATRARAYTWSKQAERFCDIVVNCALNLPYSLIRRGGTWYLYTSERSPGNFRSLDAVPFPRDADRKFETVRETAVNIDQ